MTLIRNNSVATKVDRKIKSIGYELRFVIRAISFRNFANIDVYTEIVIVYSRINLFSSNARIRIPLDKRTQLQQQIS